MQRLNTTHARNTRWISAHRQSWFAAGTIELSPGEKRRVENSIRHHDALRDARWKDYNADQRANTAVYELVEAENVDARAIAQAVRAENSLRVEELKKTDPPIRVINELLKASNLPIELSI